MRSAGNEDRLPPWASFPERRLGSMEQFLLDVLAGVLAAVIAAIVIRHIDI